MKKVELFDQNHGLTPLEKCHFCAFSHRRFPSSERVVCYIKRRKSLFLHVFSGSMTWEYRGYNGLQGVTAGDKGLQGVAKDYRNFFLTRTFPDTFS